MTVTTSPPDAGSPPGVPGSARPGLEASLHAVTEALEEDARRQSALILARADADSAATLEAARTEGERLVQAARAEGTATAQRLAAGQLVDARREARHTVLEAQRALYEAVRRDALEQLANQGGSPAVTDLVARLGDVARARLGDQAEVRQPDRGGPGIVAVRDGVVFDLSAPVLVELELQTLGDVLEGLWA
jgi:vacuolar-type H+-ATPase subunit E/Vma4